MECLREKSGPMESLGALSAPVSPQQLIGNTPILDMSSYSLNEKVKILAKAEYLNPSGSIKDRIAVNMITNAEKTG